MLQHLNYMSWKNKFHGTPCDTNKQTSRKNKSAPLDVVVYVFDLSGHRPYIYTLYVCMFVFASRTALNTHCSEVQENTRARAATNRASYRVENLCTTSSAHKIKHFAFVSAARSITLERKSHADTELHSMKI